MSDDEKPESPTADPAVLARLAPDLASQLAKLGSEMERVSALWLERNLSSDALATLSVSKDFHYAGKMEQMADLLMHDDSGAMWTDADFARGTVGRRTLRLALDLVKHASTLRNAALSASRSRDKANAEDEAGNNAAQPVDAEVAEPEPPEVTERKDKIESLMGA